MLRRPGFPPVWGHLHLYKSLNLQASKWPQYKQAAIHRFLVYSQILGTFPQSPKRINVSWSKSTNEIRLEESCLSSPSESSRLANQISSSLLFRAVHQLSASPFLPAQSHQRFSPLGCLLVSPFALHFM